MCPHACWIVLRHFTDNTLPGFWPSMAVQRAAALHLMLLVAAAAAASGAAGAKVPAMYVFGDSTADVGNNDYLPWSIARADFPHNGVDFPGGKPTGRFSNGLIGVDFIGEQHRSGHCNT